MTHGMQLVVIFLAGLLLGMWAAGEIISSLNPPPEPVRISAPIPLRQA